jgi:hypothetical protein
MLKSKMQFVVVAVGLSSLALSTGCGRDKQAFDAKLAEVKAVALKSCAEGNGSKRNCKAGVEAAVLTGRMLLPRKLQIRTEGEERVTEVRVESLGTYMAAVEDNCIEESTYTIIDSEGFGRRSSIDQSIMRPCMAGARAFFVEFGKSFELDIATMGANDSVVRTLKREPIQAEAETTKPASKSAEACHGQGNWACN